MEAEGRLGPSGGVRVGLGALGGGKGTEELLSSEVR
jgi:hypothetical protein